MAEQNSYEKAQEIIRLRESIGQQEQAGKEYDYEAGTVTTKPSWHINLPRPPQTFINPEMKNRYPTPILHDRGPWNEPVRVEPIQQNPYWSDARRIGRYYYALQSLPPGTQPPVWLDKQGIEAAYKYLQASRPNEHWTTWDPIKPEDPINIVLNEMQAPPPNMMPSWERDTLQKRWEAQNQGYTPDPNVREESSAQAFAEREFDRAAYKYEELPLWKKTAQMLTPVIQYGIAGLGGAALGGRALGVGGAIAGAVGMMGGTYLAAQIQKKIDSGEEITDQEKDFLTKFAYLDYLEQQAEKGAGLGNQIWASLFKPEKYGELNEIFGSWENFKAAYHAGSIYYESFGAGRILSQGWEEDRAKFTALEKAMKDGNYWEVAQKEFGMSQEDIIKSFTTAPGAGIDTRPKETEKTVIGSIITSNDDIITKIPGEANAVNYFMKEARDKLQKGASANDVYLELSTKFGYWGGMKDLVGSLVLDPLDLIGPATNKMLSTAGKISGKTTVVEAFSNTQEDLVTNTRTYGQLIRSKPAAEAAQYSAFSRWVAGIDAAGNVKDMSQTAKLNPFNYLFGLTPKARANHVLTTFMDGVYNLVAPESNPNIFVKMIKAIANLKPRDAVAGADAPTMRIMVGGEATDVNIPGWYLSAEAQSLPTALKDGMPVVDELMDVYNLADGQRTIIKRVAEYMGQTPEDFIAALNKMSPDEANKTYTRFMQTLNELKAQGDPNAGKLLDMLIKDDKTKNLNGVELQKMAKIFFGDKGVPFNEAMLKFRMLEALETQISKWAVDYFGVKPDKSLMRLGIVIKKAQSALLLGFNPAYFFNNAINNLVTMQWDGILHIGYEFRRQEYMQDFGTIPVRYLQGAGAADYGNIGAGTLEMFGAKSKPIGLEIHKASQAERGTIQLIDQLLNKGEKVQIFARLSQAFEKWSSQVAVANAISEYMNRAHRVGKGIPKMPDGTRAMLEAIEPGLSKKVSKMLERNISKPKIEQAIWGEGGVATSIRDFLDPEATDMLDKLGIIKEIDEKLVNATTKEQIYQAFTDVKKKLQQEISNQVIRNMDKITQDAVGKAQIEGPQGVLDIYDNLVQMRVDFWLKHFEYMAEVAENAKQLKGVERSLTWLNAKDEADMRWTTFQNIEGAKLMGIMKGLGLDPTKPLYSEVFALIADNQIFWDGFYTEQQKLFSQFEADAYSLEWGDPQKGMLWDKYNQDVNDLYLNTTLKEEKLQSRLDQIFSDLYEKQFPGRVGEAEKWRNAVGTQRRRMIQAQLLWRSGKVPETLLKWGDLLGPEIKDAMFKISGGNAIHTFNRATRDKLNPRFYNEIYTRLIKDMSSESNRTAPGMPTTAAEIPPEAAAALDAEMPPQGEGIPVFITQKMRADLRDLGYTTEDVMEMTPSDAWDIINNTKKKVEAETNVTQVTQPETDVTQPETEVQPVTGEGDLFGQKPTETAAPKKQVFNDNEQEIWKVVSESKPDLNPIDETGQPKQTARLDLIQYILKHSTSAKKKMTVGPDGKWSLHWKDVTPDDLRQAIAMEQQAIDAQPSMFGEEAPTIETQPMTDEEISQVNFITDEPITPAPRITPEQQAQATAQRRNYYDEMLALQKHLEIQQRKFQDALPKIKVGKEAAERTILAHLEKIGQSDRFQHVRLVLEGIASDWARNNPGMKPEDWYETFFIGRGDMDDAAGLSQLRYNPRLIEDAISKFGTTYDIKEAGFILPDGTLLDLSGRSQASGYKKVGTRFMIEKGRDYLSNQRSLDHREVTSLLENVTGDTNLDGMLARFMAETGAVRIDGNSQFVEAASALTREQINIIKTYFDEYTSFDITDPKTGRMVESINPSNRKEFIAAIDKINNTFKTTLRQEEINNLYQEVQTYIFHDEVMQGLKPNAHVDGKKWKVNLRGTTERLASAKDNMVLGLQEEGYAGTRLDDIIDALNRGEIAYYEIDPYNVGAQGPVRKYVFYQTDDTSKGGWSHLRYLANEYIQAKYANDVDQYMTKRGLTEYDFRDMREYFNELEAKGFVKGIKAEFLYQDGAKKPNQIHVPDEIHNYARMLLRSTDKEILFALYDAETREMKVQLLIALNKQDPVRAKQIYDLAMEKKDHYLWQEDNDKWYHYQSEKVINAKMPDNMKANSLIALLKNNTAPEELETIGIVDWLSEQKGSVSKQEVLDYIRANMLEIEETVLSDGDTKFNSYLLRGGTKIRNLLIRLPATTDEYFMTWKQVSPESRWHSKPLKNDDFRRGEWAWHWNEDNEIISASFPNDSYKQDARNNWFDGYYEDLIKNNNPDFNKSHWSQPNVLAHTRFQEFTDTDGKRVLLIDEIQSDWHQQGKEQGYKVDLSNNEKALEKHANSIGWKLQENVDGTYAVVDMMGEWVKEREAGWTNRLEALQDALLPMNMPGNIPDAPFKTTWPDLVMKRMIRWAAENGYDRVAWTPGDVQAARYNLAKQVHHITSNRKDDGTYRIMAISLDKSHAVIDQSFRAEQLPDVVGKELANKIITNEDGIGYWEGDDLKVGGAGMRNFYDEKIPNKVKKYIKKWNSELKEIQIPTDTKVRTKYQIITDDTYQNVPQRDWDIVAEFEFEDEAQGYMQTHKEPLHVITVDNTTQTTQKVHAFDVTPEMRDAVMSQGQALFQQKRGATRWAEDGLAIMHLFESADVSTIIHEVVHVYTPQMSQQHSDLVRTYIQGLKSSDLPKELRDKFNVKDDWKSNIGDDWNQDPLAHPLESEILSTAFERYMAEGKSPIPSLTEVFIAFKKWMTEIYNKIAGSRIDIKLDANVKKVFDEWLAGDKLEEITNASTKPPLDWAEYIKLKDTMNEERLYLMSGTINGKKISPEYLEVLKRNYEKHKAIVDELDKIYDKPVVRPGFEEEMARSQAEIPTKELYTFGDWFWSKDGQVIQMRGGSGLGSNRVGSLDINGQFAGYHTRTDLVPIPRAELEGVLADAKNKITQPKTSAKPLTDKQKIKQNKEYLVTKQAFLDFLKEANPEIPANYLYNAGINHMRSVEAAIKAGKEVPPEVLADYPELQVTKLPEPTPPENMFTGRPRQEGFFDKSGEDLPLLSGTAQRAQAETFAPQEIAPQDALFNMRDQLPTIEGRRVEGGAEGTPLFGQQTQPRVKTHIRTTADGKYQLYIPDEIGISANEKTLGVFDTLEDARNFRDNMNNQPIETSTQPDIIKAGGIDATQTEGNKAGIEPGRTGSSVQPGRTDSRRNRDASGKLVIARAERTAVADPGLVPANVSQQLAPHQIEGTAKAIQALSNEDYNRRGFILADGTGAGKTRQELAIAKTYADQGRPVVIVTKAEVIKADWNKETFSGSFRNDADTMGVNVKLSPHGESELQPGQVYLTTYERMEGFEYANGLKDAIFIFDEAHALKNAESNRAKTGIQLAGEAYGVVYASATPADKPQHIDYMMRANIFEGKSRDAAYRSLGLTERTIKVGKGRNQRQITVWVVDSSIGSQEVYKRMGKLFDRMTEQGQMIKREISMDGIPVQFQKLPIDAAGKAILQKIEDAFTRNGEVSGLQKALVLMHQRRQQEPMKIPIVKNLVKQELDAGRQVVVFLSRVNDSEVVKRTKMWGSNRELVDIIEEVIHQSEGTVKTLKAELEAMGIKDIAELHGGTKVKAPVSMDQFQNGSARVMLATLESGGTGINLDDITGNAPRTIIFMTAPFSAVENIQGAGRVWRMTTKSQPKIVYLFGDTPTDQWNAAIIAEKMKMLGATVEGEVRKLDIPQDMDADLYLSNAEERYGNVPKDPATYKTPLEGLAYDRSFIIPNRGELGQEAIGPKDVKTIALDPEGNEYQFEYKVVDLDELITSHSDALEENPNYPQELQPRERDRAASMMQVDTIAKQLKPTSYLLEQHATDRGTPTIGKGNMVVESGNGRTIALRRARAMYPEKYKAYQDAVKIAAEEYGLSTEGIEHPVLVREMVSEDVNTEKYTSISNKGSSAVLSDYEMAIQDLKFVSDDMLSKLQIAEGELALDALFKDVNQPLVAEYMANVPTNERGNFLNKQGELSISGARRMTYAMMLKVFPDEAGQRLLSVITDQADEGIKNMNSVLIKTMGELAALEGAAKTGRISPDLALAEDLTKAIDVYVRLRQEGKTSASDYVKQMSIYDKELNDFQGALLLFIDSNKRSESKLRRMISGYVKSALSQDTPGQDLLFGGQPTKGEILDGVTKTLGKETDFASTTRAEEVTAPAVSTTGEVVDSTIEQPAQPTQPVRPQPEEPVAKPQPAIEETEQVAVGAPFGTADQVLPPPYDEMLYEGWLKDVLPALNKAEKQMTDAEIPDRTSIGSKLTKDQQKELRKYLGNVYSDMTNTKMAAIQYAMGKRDFALHDYTKRTGADNILGGFYPYQFWYTRSALNWFARVATNPGVLADYYRIMTFGQESEDKEGFPTRLKNKIGIPVPFLPDWMGKTIYVDPFKQIYPFRQLTAPFRRMQDDNNMLNKKAAGVVQQQLEDGEITEEQAKEAINNKSGTVWSAAIKEAKTTTDLEFDKPFDYASALVSPSLPLSIAANFTSLGDKDKISQLPITRVFQALTSMLGVGGPRGVNVEAPFRRGFGLDEVDQFEDYRINRELSNMVADGLVDPQVAIREMIDGKGPNYTTAQTRVAKQMNPRTFFSSVGLDFFPEGEQEMRSIAIEYSKALEAYFEGKDKNALTEFWDEFPEYEARIAANNTEDPEKMLRTFLRSRIWEQFNDMNSYEKNNVIDAFGQTFELSFMNKDTRNYDDISTETYASWAKSLGSKMPEQWETATEIPGAQIPEEVDKLLDKYLTERDQKFPGISETLEKLYSLDPQSQELMRKNTPIIGEYQDWRNKFIALNPATAEYLTGEQSELSGLPQEIQVAVYQYRAQISDYFPGIYDTQSAYFDITSSSQKRAFLDKHPELTDYWDFRREYSAAYPKAAPYILSDESLAKYILGEDRSSQTQEVSVPEAESLDPALLRLLASYFYNGRDLTSGARAELTRLWKAAGSPAGSMENWLNAYVWPTLK